MINQINSNSLTKNFFDFKDFLKNQCYSIEVQLKLFITYI